MSFRQYRDAVIDDIRKELVINVSEGLTDRPFLQVAAAPRVVDEDWLEHVIRKVPSVHVAFIGSGRRLERLANGQLRGPWSMVAHVVVGTRPKVPAETLLLDKLYEFAMWIEGRTFGYPLAAPAQVVEIENLWNLQVDKEGFAIGSVSWQQMVTFGRDLAAEAFAEGGPDFPVTAPAGGLPSMRELFVHPDGSRAWPEED
jgi:hypothetical protein